MRAPPRLVRKADLPQAAQWGWSRTLMMRPAAGAVRFLWQAKQLKQLWWNDSPIASMVCPPSASPHRAHGGRSPRDAFNVISVSKRCLELIKRTSSHIVKKRRRNIFQTTDLKAQNKESALR